MVFINSLHGSSGSGREPAMASRPTKESSQKRQKAIRRIQPRQDKKWLRLNTDERLKGKKKRGGRRGRMERGVMVCGLPREPAFASLGGERDGEETGREWEREGGQKEKWPKARLESEAFVGGAAENVRGGSNH